MRTDFVAFILSHGRSDRIYTYQTLRTSGYTGPIVIVVDNEERTIDEYRSRFGNQVYVFDKSAVAREMDEGDNFNDRRAVIYARNACFAIAKELGYEWFIELDDDYTAFRYRKDSENRYVTDRYIKSLDAVLETMLRYYEKIPALSIAMAQGGDFIGGKGGSTFGHKPKRKCMNSFICSIKRPFQFFGRINEDVNTYVTLGSRGGLFLTIGHIGLEQKTTQSNAGGMTEMYLDSGTYVKSFYTVMYHPSSVKIWLMGENIGSRIHHKVKWRYTVPVILSEEFKKAVLDGAAS